MYTIYGRTEPKCPYCERAKTLLDIKGENYEFFELGDDYSREDLRSKINLGPNDLLTVPQIWYGDEYVGGYDKLAVRFGITQP